MAISATTPITPDNNLNRLIDFACSFARSSWDSASSWACLSSRSRASSASLSAACCDASLCSRKSSARPKSPVWRLAQAAFGRSFSIQPIAICRSGSRYNPALSNFHSAAVSANRSYIRADCDSSSTQRASCCQTRIRLSCEMSMMVSSANSVLAGGINNVRPGARKALMISSNKSRGAALIASRSCRDVGRRIPRLSSPFSVRALNTRHANASVSRSLWCDWISVKTSSACVDNAFSMPPIASKSSRSISTDEVPCRSVAWSHVRIKACCNTGSWSAWSPTSFNSRWVKRRLTLPPATFAGPSIAWSNWSRLSLGTRYSPSLIISASPVNREQSPRKSDRIVSTT